MKGARQIGKTETILHFTSSNYENVVYINFVTDEKYKVITRDGYEPQSIIKNITLVDSSKKFIPHKTVIIFDELQEYPEIATSLKFFKIDGQYDVICSGSLLGISYKRIQSNSVGYKTDYEMSSLDFEEFLWATGYETALEEGFEDSVQFYAFEELDSRKISSTNTLERLNREIRRRSSVVGIFPSTDSYIRLITSYLLEYSEDWQTERSYMNAGSIKVQKEILFNAA